MFRFCSLLLFIILSACGSISSQVDSTYIGFFDKKHSIRPYFAKSFTALSHEVDENDEISYFPNTPFGIGLGLSYKGLSVSGSYGFQFMRERGKGKTKAIDFQTHIYKRKVVFDFFFQDYKGMFVEDAKENIELFPDIHLTQYGVFGQYVFNGNKFSYQAAFNQNQKQLKSAGSWLLGGSIYLNKARSDSTLVFTENRHSLNNFQFGVNLGYAYTWVASKRFFVSGSISVGVNVGAESFSTFGKEKLKVYPSLFPRISFGYNHDDWSIGMSGINNRVYILFSEQSKMSFNTGHIEVSFIKRFSLLPGIARKVETKFFGE